MRPVHLILLGGLLVLGVLLTLLASRDEDAQQAPRPEVAEPASGARDAEPTVPALDATSRPAKAGIEAVERQAFAPGRTEPDAAVDAPEPNHPTLTGYVVDEQGRAIPGAEVWASLIGGALQGTGFGQKTHSGYESDEPEAWALTDEEGRFELVRGKRKSGSLNVEVWARGFQPLQTRRSIEVDAGDAHLGVFSLRAGVVLAGVVTDADGVPLEDANVLPDADEAGVFLALTEFSSSMAGSERGETTDAEGRFELGHRAPGPYSLRITHERHAATTFEGVAEPAGSEHTGLVLRMQPSAQISGEVLGFPPGREGISVVARELEGEGRVDAEAMQSIMNEIFGAGLSGDVDAGGEFTVYGLIPGRRYELRAVEGGRFMDPESCSEGAVHTAPRAGVELVWDAGASVSFSVVDADTGDPVDSVAVRASWKGEEPGLMPRAPHRESFASGEVQLDELRPPAADSELELQVTAEGYLTHELRTTTLATDEHADLGTVRLQPAPVVRVRVLDASDGEPVKRANVKWITGASVAPGQELIASIQGQRITTRGRTDADGVCELRPPALGEATLTVTKGGYADWSEEQIGLRGDSDVERTVSLLSGGRIEVLVLDGSGHDVPGTTVMHRQPDGRTRSHTSKDGPLVLENLETGEHRLRVAEPTQSGAVGFEISVSIARGGSPDDEDGVGWESVSVSNGSSARVVLTAPGRADVRGSVTLAGEPLEGAEVAFLPGRDSDPIEEFIAMIQEQSMGAVGTTYRHRTDRAGRFELDELTAGAHRLRFTHDDLALPYTLSVDLREGENTITARIPIRVIEGLVVGPDGTGIPGATLRIASAQESDGLSTEELDDLQEIQEATELFADPSRLVRSDEGGRFRLTGLPDDGPYVVTARAAGWSPASSDPVTVREGETKSDVELQLDRGGTLRILVPDPPGSTLLVSADFDGDASSVPVSSRLVLVQDGQAVLEGLQPGPWWVELGGVETEVKERVEVTAGAETFVTLEP